MTKNYSFQVDITNQSSWSLFYRLQSVFQNANPANPEQTFEAMKHVIDSRNVVDHSQHENSPWRNRPAYLDSGSYDHLNSGEAAKLLAASGGAIPPKDWSKLSL